MRTAGAIGGPLVELFRCWLASSHRAARYRPIDAGSDLDPHYDALATHEDDVDAALDRSRRASRGDGHASVRVALAGLDWLEILISAGFNGGKRHLLGRAMSC
jgi:hypothetical protein